MASFQAKIGWKRQRKGENKNSRSVSFLPYPTRNGKFRKSSKTIQESKIYDHGFISSKNRW